MFTTYGALFKPALLEAFFSVTNLGGELVSIGGKHPAFCPAFGELEKNK